MASADHAHLLPPSYSALVARWFEEDTPSFDYGGYVVGEKDSVAVLYGKSKGVVAGVPFFDEVFRQVGCRVEWLVKEGVEIDPASHNGRQECARVYGKARQLLLGERLALNSLARCSGIASRARRLTQIKKSAGYRGIIAGTRKTTPGFRVVEKYGMLVGGVDTHRMDLSSMIMLKDNHVWSQGSITAAVQRARSVGGFALKIEVECRSEAEADEAITAGADIVMLDNYTPDNLRAAAKRLKQKWTANGKGHVLYEASGGITEETVASYFCDEIDILSLGSLTQGVPHVDFSLKIQQ